MVRPTTAHDANGVYEEVARVGPGQELATEEPFPVRLPVDRLVTA